MNKLLSFLLLILLSSPVAAERIKDITSVDGVRENQLVGYGLVVGLDGTGDSGAFTGQSLKSMLSRLGVTLPPGVNPKSKNVAAVALSAVLPPFIKAGQKIDLTVSALGSSKSLRGGTLLMAPLKGADGQIYAMAQGNLIVGGISASGAGGSSITVGVPSVARIPNGAMVERTVESPFASGHSIKLNLHAPDFTTAQRLSQSVNQGFGPGTARALDGTTVEVSAPLDPAHRVTFMALLENLQVAPADAAARVVVNSRTGTVVIGRHVMVSSAAITHGTLSVTITEDPVISQPEALSGGTTTVVPQADIEIRQNGAGMILFSPGVELADIVDAINRIGAAPDDLVAILQALRAVGALKAELEVI